MLVNNKEESFDYGTIVIPTSIQSMNSEALESAIKEAIAATATKEEIIAFIEVPTKQRQELIEAARKVHINTGHKPVSELARLLRREGAPLQSRAAMEQVK